MSQWYKVGPLFADHQDIAQAILAALCRSLPDDAAVIVDVPEANQLAVAMVQKIGFEPNFETARMYKGTTRTSRSQDVWCHDV